ncbi:MAG: amino acid racemase [Spirochaetes bacterium]|jgi:aspartate racemase|nr:amino acid racemase [Spirochaetota bacterium]
MKIPGIIGGVGPESTVDYYRSIISLYRERYDPHGYPELLIASIDMTRMLSMIEANDMGSLVDLLVGTFSRLRSAGADFGAIASNTPHVVFDELRKAVPMPLISIVESTTERAASAGITRAALLGTAFTMNNDFYQTSFERRGISLLVPSPDEREYIHLRIFDELEFGLVKPDTRKGFDAIIGRMREEHGIEGVVLGCTELPLLYPEPEGPGGIPLFNTARIHIEEIIAAMG